MNPFENLSLKENETLLKFPAYISMLAAYNDNKLDEAERKIAIKFAHTKTFSSDPCKKESRNHASKHEII